MFCHKCGNRAVDGAAFCNKCGTKLITNDVTQQPPNAPIPTNTSYSTILPTPPSVQYTHIASDTPTFGTSTPYTPLPEQPMAASDIPTVAPITRNDNRIPEPSLQYSEVNKQRINSEIITGSKTKGSSANNLDGNETTAFARLCYALSTLRFLDAALWLIIVIVQFEYADGGNTFFNIVEIVIIIVLAANLWPNKFYRHTGYFDKKKVSRNVIINLLYSIFALLWYGFQIIAFGIPILIPALILEVIIGTISVRTYTKFKSWLVPHQART